MTVVVHDGETGLTTVISNGESAVAHPNQPSLEEQREWWRTHTPQPRLVPVTETGISPTRRSAPLMALPDSLRRPAATKPEPVTFVAPVFH
jgi:hypothetical protein